MTVSKLIGYILIVVSLIIGIFSISMMSVNEVGVVLGVPLLLGAFVLLGIGAIAAKK